jgi:CRP/FNR family transcriptional regulator
MTIPASGSSLPLTPNGTLKRFQPGSARPAFRREPANRPAAEIPGLSSDCRDCTARTRCLITPWLAAELISPDPSSLPSQVVERGSHIFREGDAATGIYAVQSGMIKSYILDANGSEHVLTFRGRGDLLGLDGLAQGMQTSSAVALETMAVCKVSMQQLENLERRFPGWLCRLLTWELVRGRTTRQILSHKDARSRMAAFLLDFSRRSRVRGESMQGFNLSMSQQDIGNHLGLAVETVCRILSSLRKSRLIDMDHHRLVILDIDGLRGLARN